jgi:hypothetical protein
MKKNLLLVLLCLPIHLLSQITTYQPMLDSINRWTLMWDYIPVFPENTACVYPISSWNSVNLFTSQDTVINTYSYLKILNNNGCTAGYIREDTSLKKVYFVDNLLNPEITLYDFSMQTGDSLSIQFHTTGPAYYWENGVYTLDSIQIHSYLSVQRNVFYLNCHSCQNSHTLSWIEGIGNLGNPIYPYSENYADPFNSSFFGVGCTEFPHPFTSGFVSCFEHIYKVYYDSCAYNSTITHLDSCSYDLGSAINDLNSGSIIISSNPFHEQMKITITEPSFHNSDFIIYDMEGRMIRREMVSDNAIVVNRKSMSSGLYIYRMTNNTGRIVSGKFSVQ